MSNIVPIDPKTDAMGKKILKVKNHHSLLKKKQVAPIVINIKQFKYAI